MQRSTCRQSVNVLPLKFSEISFRVLVQLIVLAVFLYFTHFPRALAQASETVDPNTWITNGDVYAVAPSGNTVYIGGDFSYVGPNTGGGATIDDATGRVLTPYAKISDRVDEEGIVSAVAPDGGGGWYIGGDFTTVAGTVRNNIAHILPDGTVDESWDPNADGAVHALAVREDGQVVYVGGEFTHIGGAARNFLAALNAGTGVANASFPQVDFDPGVSNTVYALAVSGGVVYAGGEFTGIGGVARNYLAAIDAASETIDGSFADAAPVAAGAVWALSASGGTVYAGGHFFGMGGQTRHYLAAIDASTGAVTAWNPNPNGNVRALAASGGTVYVGGEFTTIGGQPKHYLAAINAATGSAITTWPTATYFVRALAVGPDPQEPGGELVYVGGWFSNVGGEFRQYIAAVDVETREVTGWAPRSNGRISALAVGDGTVYAGGQFTSIGGVSRGNLAAIDAKTGFATLWNPSVVGTVWALAVGPSPTIPALEVVYVGGMLWEVHGEPRNYLAAVTEMGDVTPWNPNADNNVFGLAVSDDGNTVYAGGRFLKIGGVDRYHIAAIEAATGDIEPWDPAAYPQYGGDVNGVAFTRIDGEPFVFAWGLFTGIGGATRRYLGKIDASGAATSWDLDLDGGVAAIVVNYGTAYIGGSFSHVRGSYVPNLAAVDAGTGVLRPFWAPRPNGWVSALAASCGILYVGGVFSSPDGTTPSIGGEVRNGLAAVRASDGTVTAWKPEPIYPYVLAAAGGYLYAGGTFNSAGGELQEHLARFEVPCLVLAPLWQLLLGD